MMVSVGFILNPIRFPDNAIETIPKSRCKRS
ncbi:uncharacterized protein METZ01_LOCUS223113, partial [marine metagenome]